MARYKDAIEWIALNDDTSEIIDPGDCLEDVVMIAPVTVVMVADLFNKDTEQVIIDIRKFLEKQRGR